MYIGLIKFHSQTYMNFFPFNEISITLKYFNITGHNCSSMTCKMSKDKTFLNLIKILTQFCNCNFYPMLLSTLSKQWMEFGCLFGNVTANIAFTFGKGNYSHFNVSCTLLRLREHSNYKTETLDICLLR